MCWTIRWRSLAALLGTALLAGCASGPGFETENVNRELEPRQAANDGVEQETVLWGGTIISTKPQEATTQIEILAFPLDRGEQPRTNRSSQGRFLAVADGYLEPADYDEGRQITVLGTLTESRTARIGEADYRYPVVEVRDMHLWPREPTTYRQEPRVNFGIGVGIMR